MDEETQEKEFREYKTILDELKVAFKEKWKNPKMTQPLFKDFEIMRTLGTGAFGRVVLVKYQPTSKYFAMKILDKGQLVSTKQVKHTFNEKRVLQSIRFPFVVHMKYYFIDASYVYLILPYVSGGEMFSHLRRKEKFEEKLAQFYAAQVCARSFD